jgi:general secretion pathway protein B
MSYILDALNKAERERRLGRIPDLHQAAAPAIPTRTRRWLVPLVLLVLTGGGLLAAMLLPWQTWLLSRPPYTAPVATEAGETSSSATRIELAEQPLTVDDPIPLSALPAELRQSLGPLNLDLHVYASQPERRFVLINSQRYRPGDWLAEGALLEAIEADGVILSYRDRRFTLTAQP